MVIQFDRTAQVYELFTAEGDWLGAFDTIEEARGERDRLRGEVAA